MFFQHRGHAQYLSFGGDEKKLANELLGKKMGVIRYGWLPMYI